MNPAEADSVPVELGASKAKIGSNEGIYDHTLTGEISTKKRIHDFSRHSERGKVPKLSLQVDEVKSNQFQQLRGSVEPITSPAVIPS